MKAKQRTSRVPLLVLAVVALTGCASTGGGGYDDPATPRNVITSEQLQEISNQTAYQAVRKLKPRWLQRRGQVSFRFQTHLLVVVDESQFVELGYLHSLRAGDVREIQYMDPRQATLKYGDRANGGAILVYLRS